MRKDDVVTKIAERTGVHKKSVSDVVENFFSIVKESMAEGNNIYFRGFGSFINKKKAKKVARNITKNTEMIIEEHFAPKFKPADVFVEKVRRSVR